MTMHDHDLGMVWAMLVAHGIRSLKLEHTDHGGHHGAIIYGRKGH